MGSHSPTMHLSSLPLFLCLLVSASGTFRNKEKRGKEGGKKEEGGGCFEVYHTEEQLQYNDVCEQSFREICGTEYSQECHYEPTTRLEEQCETSLVSEPVKVCTPGEAHKVCHQAMWNPSGRNARPATHTSASEEPGAVDLLEESKESVARDSFFRQHFSSLPCSTLCPPLKRCATLNKT